MVLAVLLYVEENMVHGISEGMSLHDLSKENLVWLWDQVGRNCSIEHMVALRTGTIVPKNESDRRHVQIREEMRRRGLPF